MIPLKLHIAGFLSYREPVELDFESFDLACISGQNGAGKSSLLDAITWSLFGEARGKDKDALINLQSKAAEVTLTFAYEGNIYRVQRTTPRGRTTVLEFQIRDGEDWRPLTEKSARETQSRIEQTLRLDYDTFVNASFFLQGKADEFTQKKASERKAILANILGLEIWEMYKNRATDKRKEIERAVDEIDGRIAEIDAELAEEDARKQKLKSLEADLKQLSTRRKAEETALENLRQAAVSLDQRLVEEKTRLEEEKRGLKEKEKEVGNKALMVNELREKLNATQGGLAELETKINQRGELENQRMQTKERLAELKIISQQLEKQGQELNARIDRLSNASGATCPLCGQDLTLEHRIQTLQTLKQERDIMRENYRQNQTTQKENEELFANVQSLISKLGSAENERLKQSRVVAQLTEQIDSIERQFMEWETNGAKRLKEVETILANERYAVKTQKVTVNLDEAERALFELKEQESAKNQEVGGARQLVGVLTSLRQRKVGYATEREEKQKLIARHKTLERAFGKDGVPALLIEQALPQVESKANDLLERLSNGQMSIRFATQSEYKDKKRDDLKETLDIQISDGAGLRDYEMYSGGERFRVDFAIRLALSEILTQRKGARLQTLVIDEGFGSQDAMGRQRLIEAINLVKPDFAKILVITHLDELKDAFPTRIEVDKNERGSTVRVI